MVGSLADRIRRHVNETVIAPARNAGKTAVIVVAGDVHKDLRLKDRMPAICGALDAQKFQDEYRVVLCKRSGPKQSSTATWSFLIAK